MDMNLSVVWALVALVGCILVVVLFILLCRKLRACDGLLDESPDIESQQVEGSVGNDPGVVNPGFMPIVVEVHENEERFAAGVFVAEKRRQEEVLNRHQEYLRSKKDSLYRKERERKALDVKRPSYTGDKCIPSLLEIKINVGDDRQTVSTPRTYASVASTPPPSGVTFSRPRISVLENRTNEIRQSQRFLLPMYQPLVIASDATPRMVGGYCINRNDKKIYYYSASSTFLPWHLRNTSRAGCPNEFEMKNLLCALIMWQELIGKYRKVEIYTDNSAVIGRNIYGRRVREFMEHLKGCLDVEIVNPSTIYLKRRDNPKEFESILMPADDLSRGRMGKFFRAMANVKPKMELCAIPLLSVQQKAELWSKHSCQRCGFGIAYSGSFRPSRKALRNTKK